MFTTAPERIRIAIPFALSLLLAIIGIPLFLRMPLWCDITLYDQAARNILADGVHFRDVFDTNTPGYVWLLAVIRKLFGWSSEALRLVDLAFLAGTLLSLDRLIRLGGGSRPNRAWFLAGALGFYLFSSEMVHCQRDVWLAFPALLAVSERIKRLVNPKPMLFSGVFRPAFVEGVLWSVAVWIKPHFLLVAAAFWLLTAWRLSRVQTSAALPNAPWRKLALRTLAVLCVDFAGSLIAGVLLGLSGVTYLISTGTWEPFLEVMTQWNTGYLQTTLGEIPGRLNAWLGWIPPWSYLLPATIVLAVIGSIDARIWSGQFRSAEQGGLLNSISYRGIWFKTGTDEERYCRAILGLVAVLWAAQSLFLQRSYLYVHAVETLIGLAVWAAFRWNIPAGFLVWFLAVGAAWRIAPETLSRWSNMGTVGNQLLTQHPVGDPNRWGMWPVCVLPAADDRSYYNRCDHLKSSDDNAASIAWLELYEVECHLRGLRVGDRELVCWDDSTHPLYAMLNIRPGLRFMHVNTARMISEWSENRVQTEFRANGAARFAVIDLEYYAIANAVTEADRSDYREPGPSATDLLPPIFRAKGDPDVLPFPCDICVFRSGDGRGRYVVIALK